MNHVPRRAWSALVLLSVAELMGMSLWFTASALSPELAAQWRLSEAQAGWLPTVVQLGFVAGTAVAAFLNLADIFPARRYFCVSALVLRFPTGFFLAGVYPPAMKMIATWFRHARGFAIGTIVGALTVGMVVPYLPTSVEGGGAALVLAGALLACAASGLLVLATGPTASSAAPSRGSWRGWCCVTARPASPSRAIRGTCGSSTRCGRRSRSSSGVSRDLHSGVLSG